MAEAVEQRLLRAPVEPLAPVADELAQVSRAGSILPAVARAIAGRQSSGTQAAAEIFECFVGNPDGERLKHGGLLRRFPRSFQRLSRTLRAFRLVLGS
jgi:hypothetical protein